MALGVCRDETPGARREEPVLAACPRLIMFPMQVPARILSPRDAILPLLLAATLLIPTSGSVTANAATLALGKQVSDTLQLGRSGVAIVLPEGDWRVSGLVRPRQIGAPYALAAKGKRSQARSGSGQSAKSASRPLPCGARMAACASTSSPLSAQAASAAGGSGYGPPRLRPKIFSLTGGRRSATCGERGYPYPGHCSRSATTWSAPGAR